MSVIIQTARAIMAAVQPLTGNRATGTVTVKAVDGDVSLPRGTYALPVVDGQVRPTLAIKTASGPNSDESWTVKKAGTDVSMFSNIGGVRHNFPKDTVFIFDPPISEIASATAKAAFSGGTDLTTFGSLRDIVMYEHLAGSIPLDLSRSGLKGFPGALISWVDDEPADGSTTSMTMRPTRLGTRKAMFKIGYQIAVITERGEGDHARRAEGLEVLDQMAVLLADRNAIDEEPISNPSGFQVVRRWRETGGGPVYQRFYVYGLLINAMHVLVGTHDRTYQPWKLATLDVNKKDEGEPIDFPLVEDVEIDMDS